MKTQNPSKYPVFEADQVLSQKHLNRAISYLEEQDRLTRVGGIGVGIICGLEISHPQPNQITISCGTAITSLGYQINWEEKTFSYYHPIELSADFLVPKFIDGEYLELTLPHAKKYEPLKNSIELLPTNTLEVDRIVIPNNFFKDKIVILLLETLLIDEKNCVTTNCDDKGKRIEFKIRPLLISINQLNPYLFPEYPKVMNFEKISLPRYNVPHNQLITGSDVLNEFKKNLADSVISNVSDKISLVYKSYKSIISNTVDFNVLNNPKTALETVINANKDSIHVQYLWDWMSDISSAYNEIIEFNERNPSLYCVDETMFPFHVVLGKADDDDINYRTPFFSTQNSSLKNKQKRKELSLLFERLVHLIKFWITEDHVIKVTPSFYGDFPLSKKSIPFYYDYILELNKKWSPKKTGKNKNNEILSYHSEVAGYTTLDCVKKPLLYDIEPYNFFRIEGHIGKNYQEAIKEIIAVKEYHNLPFKVIALNAADLENHTPNITTFEGDWGEIELNYDLVRRDWENVIGKSIEWILYKDVKKEIDNYPKIKPYFNSGRFRKNELDLFITYLKRGRNSMVESFSEFLKFYSSFIKTYEKIEDMARNYRENIFQNLGQDENKIFAEDLIDHLDEIIMVCQKGEFRALYQAAMLKWKEISQNLTVKKFFETHSGIEHKAGVNKGGTFILIYESVNKNRISSEVMLNANPVTGIASVDARPLTSTTALAVPVIRKETSDCNDKLIKIKADFERFSYNILPYEYRVSFMNHVNRYLFYDNSIKETVVQNTVIADFYLPYICCGEGDNINFILEKSKVGDFNHPDFNEKDFNTPQ